ncbi:hypothetical protein R3P38DRAFT_2798729 [Favolaschia claudopus]|uniref:Uncharacterized protein n=1 Tax=Favolaschia claudopus TaxID=2862362 RepID=A0AAW0A0Z7_9AGAR
MSSTTVEVILSKSEEDIIRSLHKTLRATHYEDPSDQRKFLEECARVLLVFQNRPSSFAMSTELGEYVFLLRAEMHKNSLVLPSPASNYYSAVVDFAGKVARKRIEYFRNLKLAPIKPLPAIDAAKANGSQQEVPDTVAHTSKGSKKCLPKIVPIGAERLICNKCTGIGFKVALEPVFKILKADSSRF